MISMEVEMERDILRVAMICLVRTGQGPQLGLTACLQGVLSLQKRLHALEAVFKSDYS